MEKKEYGVNIGQDLESQELLKNCQFEVYDPKKVLWEQIREEILGIELTAFGEEKAFEEEILKNDFENPTTAVVLTRDNKTNKIVGFTYAKPTITTYPEDFPERQAQEDTAYIYDTAFDESYQHKGLIAPMMGQLEEQLINKGFSFAERDCANSRDNKDPKQETYADKVRRHYGDRIIKEELHDSEYGPQVFFRITLNKPEQEDK